MWDLSKTPLSVRESHSSAGWARLAHRWSLRLHGSLIASGPARYLTYESGAVHVLWCTAPLSRHSRRPPGRVRGAGLVTPGADGPEDHREYVASILSRRARAPGSMRDSGNTPWYNATTIESRGDDSGSGEPEQ